MNNRSISMSAEVPPHMRAAGSHQSMPMATTLVHSNSNDDGRDSDGGLSPLPSTVSTVSMSSRPLKTGVPRSHSVAVSRDLTDRQPFLSSNNDRDNKLVARTNTPTSVAFIEFNVKQKQRMGFKSDAVLRINTGIQVLAIFKARTKQAKQTGMKNVKSYPCDSVSEMSPFGETGLSIVIADGTHNNKGTKKEFQFITKEDREMFVNK